MGDETQARVGAPLLRAASALGGVILLFLVVAWQHPLAVSAATLTVTTTNDTVANGDGLSLREAITCINAGFASQPECPSGITIIYHSSDTITFSIPGAAPHTISLTSGSLPTLTSSVDIDGPGAASLIIDGGCTPDNISGICIRGGARPLAMSNSITVTLSGLTIQHGNAVNGDGGAILVGNTGSLTVLSCAFLNNVSSGASANGGGAIAGSGAGIAIASSVFTQNSAGAGGTVSTQGGGAIYMNGGTLNLDSSSFTENFTLGTNTSGGALLLRLATTTVRTSDLFVGSAIGGGGGIEQIGGTLTVTNTSFSANTAISGGALDVNNSGTATLKNATITANSATAQSGTPQGGGIRVVTGSTVNVTNTIVAKNIGPTDANGPDAFGALTSHGHNLIGETNGNSGFIPVGSGGTDQTGTANAPLDPVVSDLTGFTGSTAGVVPLLVGSPAIDAGDDAVCTDTSSVTTSVSNHDARGASRTGFGAHCDIGAYEARGFTGAVGGGANQAAAPGHVFGGPLAVILTANGAGDPVGGIVTYAVHPVGAAAATPSTSTATVHSTAAQATVTANGTVGTYTVTASAAGMMNTITFTLTNGSVPCVVTSLLDPEEAGKRTLRDVINTANGNGCTGGGTTVLFDDTRFPPRTPETIALTASSLPLEPTATTVIDGSGHNVVISGSGVTFLFVADQHLSLSLTGLTLRDSIAALGVRGTANVTGCTFTNNTSTGSGAAIDVNGSGTLTVVNSTFSGNHNAGTPGSLGGALTILGTTTITGSTFTGNTAPNGGAISTAATLTIVNSTISGNSATGSGGGIFVLGFNSPAVTVMNSTIAGNTAGGVGSGGGIFAQGGTVNVTNTIVAANTGSIPANGPDVSGAFTSGGHNLIGIVDGSTGFTTGHDLTGTGMNPLNPLLGTLAANGGLTQTIAPQNGSPAIDAADPAACAAAPVSGKDQRGYLRKSAPCTIGAFEADPALPNVAPAPRSGVGGGSPNPAPPPRPPGAGQGIPDPLPVPRL